MYTTKVAKIISYLYHINLNRVKNLTGGKKVTKDSDGLVEAIRNVINKVDTKTTAEPSEPAKKNPESKKASSEDKKEEPVKDTDTSKDDKKLKAEKAS